MKALREVSSILEECRHTSAIPTELKDGVHDVLFALRVALDYCANAIRTRFGLRREGEGYFPIYKNKKRFGERMKERFPGLEKQSLSVYDYLESVQPFQQGQAWLMEFNTLANEGKHKGYFKDEQRDQIRILGEAARTTNVIPGITIAPGANGSVKIAAGAKFVYRDTGKEISFPADIEWSTMDKAQSTPLRKELYFCSLQTEVISTLRRYYDGVNNIVENLASRLA
jgi:hypothetical protein